VRIAYFDCFSGISGDMALGALVHAGADFDAIAKTLATLPIGEFELSQEEVDVHGIVATQIRVGSGPQGVIRTYSNLRAMLDASGLPETSLRTAQRIYRLLAQAVAKVYAKEVELVTFHEFGDLDCLVDIVGCALALEQLGVERAFCSPLPTGMGMARTEHGLMPVPGPVVLELLQGAPTYSRGIPVELVTAAGAAILAAVVEGYGDMPMMRAEQVGYGAGQLRLDFPNVARVVVGQTTMSTLGRAGGLAPATEMLMEVTASALDDDQRTRLLVSLFESGATDAWVVPAAGRHGARLVVSAVAPPERATEIGRILGAAPEAGAVRMTPVTSPPGPGST
jgi:uncharacterized protein (TIGR00299 family) protein